MSIRVALYHETSYLYDRFITLGPQTVRLRPAPHSRTPIHAYSLTIEPAGHFLNWQQDPQSNYQARIVFPEKVDRFRIIVDLVAEMTVINPFDFFLEPEAERYPFEYASWLSREIAPFLIKLEGGPAFAKCLKEVNTKEQRTIDFLVGVNSLLNQRIKYLIRMEPGVQTPEETLAKNSGSCRDSAWVLVQLLRHLGIAARFVSGYLIQLKPDQKSLDGPSGAEQDFTDLHAWCEAYLPGAGWVGLDPTSGLFAGEGHIPLAATPDPQSAAPISGALDECEAEFEHVMRITRVHEDPRVTKPYTEEQWSRIESVGRAVDVHLKSDDVRLTMGGEPTFVSIDDMDGAEWNVAAVGPNKRRLSEVLLRRLQKRFTKGALLHFGQGKWYPGEQLPRWALACYWRKDGHPIWNNPALIADIEDVQHRTFADAERFVELLAERLDVDAGYAVPAFEDPVHFLRREGQLPLNIDPADSRLKDAEERTRLRRVFERGLNEPVGYVLPLQPGTRDGGMAWESGLWMLRGKHLVLIPGDSPIGLRLPVASLPWVAVAEYPYLRPRDPVAPPPPLTVPRRMQSQLSETLKREIAEAEREPLRDRAPQLGESAPWVVRTALCVEPRDGRLHIFMPPLMTIEAYLELIAAIEDTAEALDMPVIVEGEPPPWDSRLNYFKVTPDPGVIEVNVPPAGDWDELQEIVHGVYEEARLSRLGTEKFMLDGRHTGTGGGNHVVLGGPTPADSPFLRRPDLLRSMVVYWLNHPSLSYLFSGSFVGPTSQAPRIDEARHDSVYELEIACEEVERQQRLFGQVPPWKVDRIFRNILVDMTGNTHRAEFCIDKLYSPDTATGRLGLVEFRAFEMPPHARMSLAQQLLLRALVAWFWRTPYRAQPVRWGTRLQDEFLLPHFAQQDFRDVIRDLNAAGFPLEEAWFAPHFEFRYPVHGRVRHAGIEIELREAIEPWHVLGEEPGPGGAVRYVDSSLERLQVKVSGLVDSRHLILCNRRRLPLRSTEVLGEAVAGVRYRAWQPPNCLHPTIPVDTPLVFEVYDTWSGRSLGGCSYYVSHPGGLSHESFPVNAFEAESRRVARFLAQGHTAGPMPTPRAELNPEFPLTLDLRRGKQ
ncbi:MAG: transglutaminase family protein [Planctomycetia bacterium]|nr:transglutaminase family protein [Planctomycetia bacterium]